MRKTLPYLSIIGLFAILSSTASKSPTLPLFAEYLGASSDEIGLIAAASTITGIIVNVTAGYLSDVYGRRKLLLVSGFFFASSPFLYLLVDDPLKLAIVRVYHGVATAVFTPVAIAAIADMYREQRGKAMGFFSSATLIGRLVAPSIAGVTLTLYSFPGTYLMCGLFGLLAFTLMWSLHVEESSSRRTSSIGFYSIFQILLDPRILLASTMMALTYYAMQSIETFLPLYMKSFGVEAWLTGLIFSVELGVIALLKPYGGHLYDVFGAEKIIVMGSILGGLGAILIGLTNNYVVVLIAIIVFAAGVAFITASIPPMISKLVTREAHGTALGAMETIKDVGQALGPIVTGLILTTMPYTIAFIITGAVILSVILLNMLLGVLTRKS